MNLRENKSQNEQNPDKSHTETAKIRTESSDEPGAPSGPEDSSNTLPEHFLDTILHKKCALCVHKNSLRLAPELEFVKSVWADLYDKVKKTILDMIRKEGIT